MPILRKVAFQFLTGKEITIEWVIENIVRVSKYDQLLVGRVHYIPRYPYVIRMGDATDKFSLAIETVKRLIADKE